MGLKKLLSGIASIALSLTAFAGAGSHMPQQPITANAAQANWNFDFGGNGAAGGFTGVSASDGYNSGRGYGFSQTGNMANVSAAGSGALSDAVQFKSTAASNTFNVDLPKGLYQVTVTLGNTNRTSVKTEGMLQLINLTGNNCKETFQIPVTDGQLNIQAVPGKEGYAYTMSALEIKQLSTDPTMAPTIWICGDSTVANYYNVADTSQHGWGQFLGSYVDSSFQIRNMAASGQYAKGFVDAGQFDAVEYYGKSGDYYIIAIGINDTNYSNRDEYNATVTDMVKRAKAKGMEVVLVKQQGRRGDLTRSPKLTGRWFGDELDKIGSAQNVRVLDLFTPWQDFGLSVGYDGMASYYAIQANGTNDDLHQSTMGAKKLAEIMGSLLKAEAAPEKTPVTPEAGVSYTFKNMNSGLYMEVADGKAEAGANVQQWGANKAEAHNTWTFKQAVGDYYWMYSNLGDGNTYVLDVADGKKDNGTNIGIYTNNTYSSQYFKILDNGDGTVTIVTRASRDASAVEVTSAKTENGANIQQWELNGHDCQKWIMEKVSYSQPVQTTAPVTEPPVIQTTTQPVISGDPVLVKFPGDANCDNTISLADALAILQFVANEDKYPLSPQGLINADVYDDGITAGDALLVQQHDVGMITLPEPVYSYPVQETTAPPATEPPVTEPVHIYAVKQNWDGVKETTNAGFESPDGYVNLDNAVDTKIYWTVNVSRDGNYYVSFRTANGTTTDRKMKVVVNNDENTYWVQPFTGTGSWTEWADRGIVLPLKAGDNYITMISLTSEGGPNFDYLTASLTDEPVAEPYDPSQEPQNTGSDKPVIYIAGDSTVQSYRESYAPQQGWGYYLGGYFTDNVTVQNHSIAGRSSKSFYDQGRFQTITDSLKQGDFVMIQFAINDADYTKEERYAPVGGNVDNPAQGSYEWYMTQFIKDTQAKGATPVLVTTTIGMKAYSGGRFVNSYDNYCNACKSLTKKYNIPCIDLNSLMVAHYNSIGYDQAKLYHLMGVVSGSTDGTHFTETGANKVAGLVAGEVKNQNISGLSAYVK